MVPEEFPTEELRVDFARRVQHTVCRCSLHTHDTFFDRLEGYRLVEILRYHNPVRLGEGIRFLRWLEWDYTSCNPGKTLLDDE